MAIGQPPGTPTAYEEEKDTVSSAPTHSTVGGNGTDGEDGECQDEISNQEHGHCLYQACMAHHEP